MLTWYLSTLKQQYDHRADLNRKRGKPLNPVLGEYFQAHFDHPTAGTTHLISEQVSHHPPVTAYKLWNPSHSISLTGYHAQKTFWENRTINLHKIGQAVLSLSTPEGEKEEYLLTFPQLHLEGFLPPPPYPELSDKHPCYIACASSGYISQLTFSGKGWLRGKRHTFSARLFHASAPSTPLFTASGTWTDTLTVLDHRTTPPTTVETYNAASSPSTLTPLTTAPLPQQSPLESRRLWSDFTAAMQRRDMSAVTAEKTRIETRQRELRLQETRDGKSWNAKFFSRDDGAERERLLRLCSFINRVVGAGSVAVEPELTAGVWVWDERKYCAATATTTAAADADEQRSNGEDDKRQKEKEEEDPFGDRYAVA